MNCSLIMICKENVELRNIRNQFLPSDIIKLDLPGQDKHGVEAGEAVPGRTDGHVWEVQVRDGEDLDSG